MRMLIDALIDLPIKLNKKIKAKFGFRQISKSCGDDDVFIDARFDYNRRSSKRRSLPISDEKSSEPENFQKSKNRTRHASSSTETHRKPRIRQRAGSLSGYVSYLLQIFPAN